MKRRVRGAALAWAGVLLAGLMMGAGVFGRPALAAGPQAITDPPALMQAATWSEGLTELSGALAKEDRVASGLLAGEGGDLTARVALRVGGSYSGTTGVVFAFEDAQTLWLAGYNAQAGRLEILRQAGGAPEVAAAVEAAPGPDARLAFELKVSGQRATLVRDGIEILHADADQPLRGAFGVGSVYVRGYELVIETAQFLRADGSAFDALAPGSAPWRIFSAPDLVEGAGSWGVVNRFIPPVEREEEAPRADLLLDLAPVGERYRREVELRTGTGYRGLGMAGLVFGYRDPSHYNLLGLDPELRRVVLWHRSSAGFEPLAAARLDLEGEWVSFAVEAEGDRVQVSAGGAVLFDLRDPRFVGSRSGLATYGMDTRPAVWRSSAQRGGGEPLPPKQPDDLLAHALGARVLYLEPPHLEDWLALIDHPLGGGEAASPTGEAFAVEGLDGPVAVVFAFPYQRVARVEELEVVLTGEGDVGPVRFLASMDTPLSGFSELAVLDPASSGRASATIDPVTAKYLRVEFPQAAGRSGQVAELYVRGSLQGRAQSLPVPLGGGAPAPDPSDLEEQEPNDQLEQAMRLPPGLWVGGNVGAGDVDHYRLHLPPEGGRVLLTGRNPGPLPARVVVLDAAGREVSAVSVEQLAQGWSASYELGGGTWYVRTASDPRSLTVLFDDSGSMGHARDALPRLLLGLADRVGPGLRVKLMKYAETPVEIFDFVDDPDALRAAVQREVEATGGTETLAGLAGGIDSLKAVVGNRALLVALDGVDGYADAEAYLAFWEKLVAAGFPVYVVGLGQDEWDSEDRVFGLSDRNFFSELAWASRGQFLINPTVKDFERGAAEVLGALSAAVPYRLRADFIEAEQAPEVKGQGRLQVELAPAAARERVRTVELILDASNSMWGRIDERPKIEIAREVLRGVIEGLPAGVHLGLRVYGHRWARTDPRACSDSERVFPIGPADREALVRHIQAVSPKGRTPLVYSLLQTPDDFKGLARGTVVLVSDGIESCDGKIDDVVERLRVAGVDLTVHVVGFDVRERNARDELARAANALGGRYFDATNASALGEALERTLQIEYELRDADAAVRARGVAGGEPVALEAGVYQLRVLLEPEPVEASVRVQADGAQVWVLSGEAGRWALKAR